MWLKFVPPYMFLTAMWLQFEPLNERVTWSKKLKQN